MSRKSLLLTCLLGWACMHASGELHAQARGAPLYDWKEQPEVVSHEEQLVRLDAWLRRLAGKFRYEGLLITGARIQEVKGIIDCQGIGEGAGVQCVNSTRIGQQDEELTRQISTVAPIMILLGIDPTSAELRFMYGDSRGLPEGTQGPLRNAGMGRFLVPCVNQPPVCRRVAMVKAIADEDLVEITLQLWRNFYGDPEPSAVLHLELKRVADFSQEEIRRVSPRRRER